MITGLCRRVGRAPLAVRRGADANRAHSEARALGVDHMHGRVNQAINQSIDQSIIGHQKYNKYSFESSQGRVSGKNFSM